MCGRFVSSSPPDEIARYFDVTDVSESVIDPSWNVAPTRDVWVVYESGEARRLDTFRWGLVPFWAKDPKVGNKMVNARAEAVPTSGAYKHAFRSRRCIVPADGFFEWKAVAGQKRKQPYLLRRADGEPLAFAGLWEEWRPDGRDDDTTLRSCTIITTEANEDVSPLHDRMPVILPVGAWDRWLAPDAADVDGLRGLLVPAPPRLLRVHPVSVEVNSARAEGPQLVVPVEAAAEQPSLLPTAPASSNSA
ncbi:MAG: SOS response-associated peptidase [Actinobacteria bacterium]|nr:SOS response-associated peptidase [Actinomycetota bacterium]